MFVVRANLVRTNHAATNTFVANGVTTKDFRTNVVVSNQNLQYMLFPSNVVRTNVVRKKDARTKFSKNKNCLTDIAKNVVRTNIGKTKFVQ
jgi:hypothetical protein